MQKGGPDGRGGCRDGPVRAARRFSLPRRFLMYFAGESDSIEEIILQPIGSHPPCRPGNPQMIWNAGAVKAASGFKTIFRSLSHRNYRLFFGGQGLSLVGTWMQQIAVSWLVYRLTDSALMLGVVGFASRIPTFLLAPAAGVLVDRWNRHRTLVVTQVLSMVQALVLAILVLTGTVLVWQIVCLTLFLGDNQRL